MYKVTQIKSHITSQLRLLSWMTKLREVIFKKDYNSLNLRINADTEIKHCYSILGIVSSQNWNKMSNSLLLRRKSLPKAEFYVIQKTNTQYLSALLR
jgi:hypothetical protein